MHMHVLYQEKVTPCRPAGSVGGGWVARSLPGWPTIGQASSSSPPGEKESPGHGPGRTCADEPIPGVATRHLVGQGREDPPAGRGPRMPDGDRTPIHVDPIPVHRIGGGTLPAFLPGRR